MLITLPGQGGLVFISQTHSFCQKKKKGGGNRKIPKHTENSMGYILSCCSDTNPRHPDTPASLGMFKEKRINELEHGHGTAEALPALALCLLISSNAHSINPS